jgi:amino acid adenylation domain-containing protein
MSDRANRIADLPPENLRLLLQQIKDKKRHAGAAAPTIGRRIGGSDAPALSFAQQRLWLLDQIEPDNTSYNLSSAFRLKGALKVAALGQSVNAIVRRHEVLRTVFSTVGGEPVQVISPPRPVPLPVADLRALSHVEREAEVKRLATEEARCPFDLSRGPLLRVSLLRSGDSEHVLLLTVHHIVFDAWSMGVFVRELCLLYEAFSAGRPSPLPELPIQYADFAAWQRQRLKEGLLESQLPYWRQRLGDASGALDLPLDRPRPKHQTFGGAREKITLPQSLSADLKRLADSQGTTLFVTLLAAFQSLLHRYTGQAEINVGIPTAGRDRIELEGLIGFFVTTLVIKTSFAGDPSFRELLAQVRQTTLEAFANQDVPFEKLVEELQPGRDLSRPPLFQVMFQLKNVRVEVPTLTALDFTLLEVERGRAQFDLNFVMAESADGLVVTVEYNTGLFEAGTVRRLLGHYRELLWSAAADPGRRVGGLGLLTREERGRQLGEWNATGRGYGWRGGAAAEVGRAARERGGEVAVECGGAAATYAELDRSADRLARYLVRLGVGREVRVGLYADRSVETCIALLAILKAGGTYVPLDPKYPRERLCFMAKDAGLAVVLVGGRLDGAALDCSAKLVRLEEEWDAIMGEEEGDQFPEVAADDAAYVIYTSGSTGRPKGVVGLQRGIHNRVAWMNELYPFAADEVCCQKTSLSFVDSVWETLGPLMSGVKLVVIPDETVRDARRLVQVLGRKGVTRVVVVPSLLRAILDEYRDLGALLPRLKYCVCSGEALPVELARRFGEAAPQARLLNLYGSSEVAADATWHEVVDDGAHTSVPIGRPIANTRAYILDAQLCPLPVGVKGRLFIGGYGLARGYLGAPALTAAGFIPDPFGDERGSRLYKTGDLARRLPDGAIEYMGRDDRQVKLRGYRIELDEVEAVLEQHSSVREAVVVARQEATEATLLIAYILPCPGPAPEVSVLRTFTHEKLPEYMVPARFVLVDSVPLTPGGKVDRRALAELATADLRTESEAAPPRTQAEEMLAEIWRKLLKVERVGLHDNFFGLGGHSLLATQVITRVRDTFKVNLPQRALFDAPTLAGLSDLIARSRPEPESARLEEVLKEVESLTAGEARAALLRESGEG